MSEPSSQPIKVGLGYWMQEVLDQAGKAEKGFDPDAVHDLRTALRRCRSMADGMMVFDSDPAWKKMRRAGKQLFQSLGALRDTHVLLDWIEKLAPQDDSCASALRQHLGQKEDELKRTAATALEQFDRHRWSLWTRDLPLRAAKISSGSPLFAHLALERWYQAHELHRRALRNRTRVGFHNLRIGLKRFRYTVENFLPSLHEFWASDLKLLQDALGDVHDLDVLWTTALTVKAFPDLASRQEWRSRIQQRRQECLQTYREKMVGRGSLWTVWRAALPKSEQLRVLGLQRLEIWASLLDPTVRHSRHVARLALQIFDGLSDCLRPLNRETCRCMLQAAALMHDVGLARANRGHHKESARLIRKLTAPLGWSSDEIALVALVARHHRGALPATSQKRFVALPKSKRWLVQFLGGILRLACACDWQHDSHIRRLQVEISPAVLTLHSEGYVGEPSFAEHLATARCLLELAYRRPVFIVPLEHQPSKSIPMVS